DAGHVVTSRITGRAAGADDRTVRQHDLQPEDVIDGDAVLQRVWPAGVSRAVAADGARRLARRVRRKMVTLRLHELRQLQVDDALAVADVDLMAFLHAPQREDHAAAAR